MKVNPNCTLELPGELLKISIIGSHFHRTIFNRFGFEKNIYKLVLNERESDVKEDTRRKLQLLSWEGINAEQSHRNTEMMRTDVKLGGWF